MIFKYYVDQWNLTSLQLELLSFSNFILEAT